MASSGASDSAGAGGAGEAKASLDVPDVVIDCDPGIDDCMALFLAFAAHRQGRIRVLALTITHGNNCDLDLLARNAAFVAKAAGVHEDIKVIKGANKPMATDYHGHSGIKVHGDNGIGGIDHPFPHHDVVFDHSHTSAAEYLVDLCTKRPGEITLVTLGPLSNIGTAIELDPTFGSKVKRVVMMGGTIDGTGNKAAHAEANVHNDPEAAKLVFGAFNDITMAGLNVTRQVELTPEFRIRLRDTCGPVGKFLFDITQHYVDLLTKWGNKHIGIHDSTAVMALIHPELFESSKVCIDVECVGELTRGATVADWLGHWGREPQTTVLTSVDAIKYHDLFCDYMKSVSGFWTE